MDSLAQHYEEKFSLIRQMTELARDTPEEVKRVLVEILEERNVMLSSLEALKSEVKNWRQQLAVVHRSIFSHFLRISHCSFQTKIIRGCDIL